jgi:hypothetical protein
LAGGNDGSTNEVVVWRLEKLRARLAEKHPETFWVKAKAISHTDGEYFHYVEVTHTRSPITSYIESLIEVGHVTVDYTLSEKPNGRVRDHGYLFKIHPDKLGSLFPSRKIYQLAA